MAGSPSPPRPPLSCPTRGKTVPRHPLGDGCLVTVPQPPLGNCTTTVHAHFEAQNMHCERIPHKMRSKGCQCTETYSLTGSV